MANCNLIRSIYSLLALVAIFSAIPAHAEDERTEETAHLEGEEREVADWVIACQRAGWEDFDVETYLSQWAEDATVVLGRTAAPGEYDVTYDYDQIVATRTFRMRGENPGIHLRYINIQSEISDDTAVVETRTITSQAGSTYVEHSQERFTLRRTEAGWRIVEDRAWLVGEVVGDERYVFDEEMWKAFDEYIAEEADELEPHELIDLLLDAFRFEEAYSLAAAQCTQEEATAEDWVKRGFIAVLIGDAADAVNAFGTAKELSPDVILPYYAMPEDDTE